MQVVPSEEIAEEILRDAGFSIIDEAYLEWAYRGFDSALRNEVLQRGLLTNEKYEIARSYFLTRCIVPNLSKKLNAAYPDTQPSADEAMKLLAEKVTDLIIYIYDDRSMDLYAVFEQFVIEMGDEGWA